MIPLRIELINVYIYLFIDLIKNQVFLSFFQKFYLLFPIEIN